MIIGSYKSPSSLSGTSSDPWKNLGKKLVSHRPVDVSVPRDWTVRRLATFEGRFGDVCWRAPVQQRCYRDSSSHRNLVFGIVL